MEVNARSIDKELILSSTSFVEFRANGNESGPDDDTLLIETVASNSATAHELFDFSVDLLFVDVDCSSNASKVLTCESSALNLWENEIDHEDSCR